MLKLLIIFLAAVAVCCVQSQNLKVAYSLFKKANHLNVNGVSMSESSDIPNMYNPDHLTIFLIHGYAGNTVARFNRLLREAIFDYRRTDDYNVIVVDWSQEASFSYAQASDNVGRVAGSLTSFIQWLTNELVIDDTPDDGSGDEIIGGYDNDNGEAIPIGADVTKFHIVGFGLGAHVAGIAGRNLLEDSKLVGRITGLDPSGHLWGAGSARLKRDDANYVEVIHTDTVGLLANGIGDAIGDVNFYANGGSNQPGCLTHSCSHDRAFELFAASMINTDLKGLGCTSKTQMNLNLCRLSPALNIGGLELHKTGIQIYRINTSRRYPF